MNDEQTQESPEFDFTRVSRQWHKELAKTLTAVTRAQIALQRPPPPDDATDAEYDAFLDRQEQAWIAIENLSDQQAELIAQVLVSVPESWLLENAPDNIDWSNTESLDWVQSFRYLELLAMIREHNVPRDEAKNSDGRSRSLSKRRGR